MAAILTTKLRDRVKGDTFNKVQFEYIGVDGTPLDLTGTLIEIDFMYKCKTGMKVREAKTTTGGVDLIDPTNGMFDLESFICDWAIGTYHWDVKVTFTDGTVKTYIQGTVKILQD